MLKQNNSTTTKAKASNKYSHLSDDSQSFLEYCESHGVKPIQKHTGQSAEYHTKPFHSNNGDDESDYICIRFLASVSYRDILSAWKIYQVKDKGFLLTNDDWQRPGYSHFHLHFDTLDEIHQHSIAPREVVLKAKKTLKRFDPDFSPEPKSEPTIELDQIFKTEDGEKIHGVAITRCGKTVLDTDGNRYSKDNLRPVTAIRPKRTSLKKTKDTYYLGASSF